MIMQVLTLLKPRYWSFKNLGKSSGWGVKFFLFSGIGLIFWAGIFAVSYRVLVYFKNVEGFGDILADKLLSMVLLVFLSLLIFSSILTSLSKIYLSKDLLLIHSLPVSREKIFLARWVESTLDSSWMVIIYTVPIFLSYGVVYDAGLFFYADIALVIFPLCFVASGISALMVLLVVMILPASRTRNIFFFLGLVSLILLYVSFRLVRPERLVNPENFASLLAYLQNLSTPSSPLLPSTWAFDSMKAALAGDVRTSLFHAALSWSGAAFLLFLNLKLAAILYFKGFTKTQTALAKPLQTHGRIYDLCFSFLPGPTRAFVIKEIKTFIRDQTQWSQIFLVGALIVIYIYNFSVLPLERSPLETLYLQNLFSFLNMALAAFVLTAITARFAYPSVTLEGFAFWIVRSGPICLRTFLWIKFFIYLPPLLILAEILIVATNIFLKVSPFMMLLSILTLLFLTPGVIAMGVGLGAAYPNFAIENAAQSVTSFGGLMFMIFSAAFIGAVIVLEAGPVYILFMADIKGYPVTGLQWAWIAGSFGTAFILCLLAVILPMRFGEKRLRSI
ncbi:MAG: hypothetical protein Q8P24_17395 [Desulfobacterales bacterium]|nr:hypothetical protein [Desulfobacterales bacterium]